MQNLFKVDGQTLIPIEIYPAVSDTVNYLTFAFMFSYDWAGLTKSAIFTKGDDEYEVVLTDDEVLESDHVNLSAGVWEISVVGDTVVDAVVMRQITTSSYNYTVTQSSATSGGVFPPSIASQVYVNVNQATPQTFVGGIPKLAADRVIENENDMVDAKHVADVVATVTADDFNHNSLSSLQGGSSTERYHMTQAQSAALHAHSNKTALDAVSGTNTGDQDVSGAISTHNTDAGAHSILARKSETMRLLISRTIGAGENVSAITWTQDDAGNALSLIEAEISAIVPPNTLSVGSAAYLRMRLNDKFGSTDYQLGTSLSSLIYLSVFRSLRGASTLRIKQIKDRIFCKTDYLFSDGTAHNTGTYTSVTTFDSTAINKIYIDVSGLTYFPDGTKIEISGRTA